MIEESPYLKHSSRLADIITAIQVMGSYQRRASRRIEKWEERLGSPVSADSWNEIIKGHPEFFRTREEKDEEDKIKKTLVSLNWRWSFDKNYAPKLNKSLNENEIKKNEAKPKDDRTPITKRPLETSQIDTLINTAIKLHESAHLHKSQKRWWIPVVVPALTAIIGTVLGFSASMIALDARQIESNVSANKQINQDK
jgi:hypothetical protein